MRRQDRLCIVSRGRAHLFGYLTAAPVPSEGLEVVLDRRGTRRHTTSSDERTRDPGWSGGDRRHVRVEPELASRGWVLLTRDEASEGWVHNARARMPTRQKRARQAHARRGSRAFVYIGAAAAAALVALMGLVVVGGLRLPSGLALGALPARLIDLVR